MAMKSILPFLPTGNSKEDNENKKSTMPLKRMLSLGKSSKNKNKKAEDESNFVNSQLNNHNLYSSTNQPNNTNKINNNNNNNNNSDNYGTLRRRSDSIQSINKSKARSSSVDDSKNRRRLLSKSQSEQQNPSPDLTKLNIIPGTCGIINHGNTCYLNSVIQLLSHVDGLAHYFILNKYAKDIENCEKKWASQQIECGRRRELSDSFAAFLLSLWRYSYSERVSQSFKIVLGTYKDEYKRNQQHDGHELLLFLLDKLHEETNQARKQLFTRRRHPAQQAIQGSSSEIFTMVQEISRGNCSHIFSLFSGYQLYSTQCPQCRTQNNRVQPFYSLSLPIPSDRTVPVYLYFLPLTRKLVRVGFLMSVTDTAAHLRHKIARKFQICEQSLVFCEMNSQGMSSSYRDEESILTLLSGERPLSNEPTHSIGKLPGGLFAIELPDEDDKSSMRSFPSAVESSRGAKSPTEMNTVRIIFTHVERWPEVQDDEAEVNAQDSDSSKKRRRRHRKKARYLHRRFSGPLVIYQLVNTHINYKELVEAMLLELVRALRTEHDSDGTERLGCHDEADRLLTKIDTHEIKKMKLHVIDGHQRRCDLRRSHSEYPLLSETVKRALTFNTNSHGVSHLKLILSWPVQLRRDFVSDRSLRRIFYNCSVDPTVAQVTTMVEVKRLTTSDNKPSPNNGNNVFFPDGNTVPASPQKTENDSIHLVDCLQAYLSAEKLTAEQAAMCQKCRSRQQLTMKSSLWTTPDILILHLKRFTLSSQTVDAFDSRSYSRQNRGNNESVKITAPVEYPFMGLDVRPYLDQGNGLYVHCESLSGADRKTSTAVLNDYLYDLISVCNHQGTLHRGHYKSYCLSPVDHKWRCYDDEKVTVVDKMQIPRQHAYILIYERRSSRLLWNQKSTNPEVPPIGTNLPAAAATTTTEGGPNSNVVQKKLSAFQHWSYRELEFPRHCYGPRIVVPPPQATNYAGGRERLGSTVGLQRGLAPSISTNSVNFRASTGGRAPRSDPLKRKSYVHLPNNAPGIIVVTRRENSTHHRGNNIVVFPQAVSGHHSDFHRGRTSSFSKSPTSPYNAANVMLPTAKSNIEVSSRPRAMSSLVNSNEYAASTTPRPHKDRSGARTPPIRAMEATDSPLRSTTTTTTSAAVTQLTPPQPGAQQRRPVPTSTNPNNRSSHHVLVTPSGGSSPHVNATSTAVAPPASVSSRRNKVAVVSQAHGQNGERSQWRVQTNFNSTVRVPRPTRVHDQANPARLSGPPGQHQTSTTNQSGPPPVRRM